MSTRTKGSKKITVFLMIASIVFLIIGIRFIFDESSQVPLWVPVGAFAVSTWLSIIRFRIEKGGRE